MKDHPDGRSFSCRCGSGICSIGALLLTDAASQIGFVKCCYPVVVPGIFLAVTTASSSADHCHSLPSLLPPLAAVGSLPRFVPYCGQPVFELVDRDMPPAYRS